MPSFTNGEFHLDLNNTGGGQVYENGEEIGHFWPDKYEWDPRFAVFRSGNSKPVARLKTVAGCVRRLTGGRWDGKPATIEHK